MIRDQQIDKISELFLDISKGLFLAAYAIPFFAKSDIIIFGKYIASTIITAIFSIAVLNLKERKK